MPIYKTLKTLIPKIPQSKSRTFLTTVTPNTHLISSPFTPLFLNPNPPFFLQSNPTTRRFLSPLSLFSSPFQGGPLFLSSPPWKLLQSSTPLYLRNRIVLRRLRVRNGYNLALCGVGSVCLDPKLVSGRVELKERSDGFVDSFVNLPNLVSLGRLVSGPVIGW